MKHAAGPYRLWILLFLFILISAEIIWSWRNDKKAYDIKETFSNLLVVLPGFQFSKFVFRRLPVGYTWIFYRPRAFYFTPQRVGIFAHLSYGRLYLLLVSQDLAFMETIVGIPHGASFGNAHEFDRGLPVKLVVGNYKPFIFYTGRFVRNAGRVYCGIVRPQPGISIFSAYRGDK